MSEDRKNVQSIKTKLNAATGTMADTFKSEIIALLDSFVIQKEDYIKILAAKDETIQTQNTLIQTQKDLIETQKLICNSQQPQQRQFINTPSIEEKEHQRSIVIAKFPESTRATPSERIAEDAEQVEKLLNEMSIEAKPAETFRMGKKAEGKIRLLKVRLQTSAQAKNILKNAKNIKSSPSFKDAKIILRRSMTLEEREFEEKLFKQQKERITELQKLNANTTYTIYGGKICTTTGQTGVRPERIDDPLNKTTYSKLSESNATPLGNLNQSFLSSSPKPRDN